MILHQIGSPELYENRRIQSGCACQKCDRRSGLAHVHLGSDFRGEVLLLLLDALAGDEVHGVDKLHAAAKLFGGLDALSECLFAASFIMTPRPVPLFPGIRNIFSFFAEK